MMNVLEVGDKRETQVKPLGEGKGQNQEKKTNVEE